MQPSSFIVGSSFHVFSKYCYLKAKHEAIIIKNLKVWETDKMIFFWTIAWGINAHSCFHAEIPRRHTPIHTKQIHHCKRAITVRASLILVKYSLRDSKTICLGRAFSKVFLCEHTYFSESSHVVSYYGSSDEWLSPNGETAWVSWVHPTSHCHCCILHPLYHSCTCALAYTAPAPPLVGSF